MKPEAPNKLTVNITHPGLTFGHGPFDPHCMSRTILIGITSMKYAIKVLKSATFSSRWVIYSYRESTTSYPLPPQP